MTTHRSHQQKHMQLAIISGLAAFSVLSWFPISLTAAQFSPAQSTAPETKEEQQPSTAQPAAEVESIIVENALLKIIESPHLAAEVSGRLERLDVSEGDRIKVGQPLGKIRDNAIQLQADRAKIAMAIARKKQLSEIDLSLAVKRHEVAQNELGRALAANKKTPNTYNPKEVDRLTLLADSTKLEIDRAKHDRELAELEVMLAENEFRQAEELLARHQLRSPVAGIVVTISKRVGEWVEPGTELMQIVNTDRLRIEGFVRSEQASRNLMDRQVIATVQVGDQQIEVGGVVAFVSPDVNPLNDLVRVFLELENTRGLLRPGTPTQAKIHMAPAPSSASSSGGQQNTADPSQKREEKRVQPASNGTSGLPNS